MDKSIDANSIHSDILIHTNLYKQRRPIDIATTTDG